MANQEGRNSYDFGDSSGFFVFVAPPLLICFIADIIWIVMALLAIFRYRVYQDAVAGLAVFMLWVAVFWGGRELADIPSNFAQQRTASQPAELVH